MSIAVQVRVSQDTVLAALSRLALSPRDKTGLLTEIGINLVENTRLRFSDEEAPDGSPWLPSLRAQQQGGQTLRDTGVLMNSFTFNVSASAVEVGTNVPYAAPLHFGATIKPTGGKYLKFRIPGVGWASKTEVHLPARPMLGVTDEDEVMITDIITQFLNPNGDLQ